MRKIIVFVIILAVAAGVGAYFYFQKNQVEVADVFPSDPLVYVNARNIDGLFSGISQTDFWQRLQRINYEAIFRESSVPVDQIPLVKILKGEFVSPAQWETFMKFFGKETAVAIYPMDVDFSRAATAQQEFLRDLSSEIVTNILLAIRLDPELQLAESLSKMLAAGNEDVTMKETTYQGHTLHVLLFSGHPFKIVYTRINDLVILGGDALAVQKAVDAFRGDKKALTQDPRFRKAQQRRIDGDQIHLYVDLRNGFDLLAQQVKALANFQASQAQSSNLQAVDEVQKRMDDFLRQASGFDVASLSVGYDQLLTGSLAFILNPSEMSAAMSGLLSCPDTDNKTIRFIPRETLGYLWAGCMDWEALWDQIQQSSLPNGNASMSPLAMVEAHLGLSLEDDILPALGKEMGGYFYGIDSTPLFPIPQLVFFLQSKDQATMEKILSLLSMVPQIVLQEESYGGYEMKYIMTPFGEIFQPGYAFLDGFLFVATNKKLIKASIDAKADKAESLLAQEAFQSVGANFTSPGRSVQFFRLGKMASEVEGLFSWGETMLASRKQNNDAFRSGQLKRLEDAQKRAAEKEQALKEIAPQLVVLEDEIWSLESKNMDVSGKKEEQTDLKGKKAILEKERDAIHEEIVQLQQVLDEFDQKGNPADAQKRLLDKVVSPILDAFKATGAVSSRAFLDKDVLETQIYFNINPN